MLSELKLAPFQPVSVDFALPDGIFIKQVHVRERGTYLPQHSHAYEHATMIAHGSVKVWVDGELDRRVPEGIYKAPVPVMIAAGVKHLFLALEDDTVLFCIHNASRSGEVEVLDEHQLVKGA